MSLTHLKRESMRSKYYVAGTHHSTGSCLLFSKEEDKIIRGMYESSIPVQNIARKYGICLPTVYASVRRAGGRVRKKGESDKRKRLTLERAKEQIPTALAVRHDSKRRPQVLVACPLQTSPSCQVRKPKWRYINTKMRQTTGICRSCSGFRGGHVSNGYRRVYINGKSVAEHRTVMERMLGRKLRFYETVHHKNGDGLDNRPRNLELFTSRHTKGARPRDLVKYLKTIPVSLGGLKEKQR
jgi:hypothetical protein